MLKTQEVTVSPKPEVFYLAFNTGWKKKIGHMVKVGDLKFSAVPMNDHIIVSDFESGVKLFHMPIPESVESVEEAMHFLGINVSVRIIVLIEQYGIEKIKDDIKLMNEMTTAKIGEKPTNVSDDLDWLVEAISDLVH